MTDRTELNERVAALLVSRDVAAAVRDTTFARAGGAGDWTAEVQRQAPPPEVVMAEPELATPYACLLERMGWHTGFSIPLPALTHAHNVSA